LGGRIGPGSAARAGRSAAGAIAPSLEPSRGANQDVMEQWVGRFLAALLALFEIKRGVEIRMRLAAFARPFLQVMHQGIEVALFDVRIGREVMFGVEQTGFSYRFIIAEQRFHSFPCVAGARNAVGTGRS